MLVSVSVTQFTLQSEIFRFKFKLMDELMYASFAHRLAWIKRLHICVFSFPFAHKWTQCLSKNIGDDQKIFTTSDEVRSFGSVSMSTLDSFTSLKVMELLVKYFFFSNAAGAMFWDGFSRRSLTCISRFLFFMSLLQRNKKRPAR